MDWEIRKLQQELKLYRDLLELGNRRELEPFLDEALGLMVKIAGADQGYLELRDPMRRDDTPVWTAAPPAKGASLDEIRGRISQSIIAEALAVGRTIETASALLDDRFRDNESVKLRGILAVLCTPVGIDRPFGVVYLHRSSRQGAFTKDDCRRVETVARHISPIADLFLVQRRIRDERDPTLPLREGLRLDGLIGRSAAFARTLKDLRRAVASDLPVLLCGESGTGRRRLARAIHDNTPSASGAFVLFDCGAAAPEQVELRIFGRGGEAGCALSEADDGTLHLHRIDLLSPRAQARLVATLQSQGGGTHRRSRLLVSTSADLSKATRRGDFDADLLQALRLRIRLPTASARKEDLGDLAAHFVEEESRRQGFDPPLHLSIGARCAIEASVWPGNLAQLAGAVEVAASRARDEGVARIEARHVFPADVGDESDIKLTYQEATRRFQRHFVARVLEDCDWNISETARRLDVARSHIYNLVKAFGLERGAG